MAFTTLEQRYNDVSKQIYNRFVPSTDQLVVVKPNTNGVLGSKSRIKNDSRLLPLVSTARDISRISKFLSSNDGILFLGKQSLLQTGNTFAETRFYNPLEALINTDPFIGRNTVRHLGFPLFNFKTPTRDSRGSLQQETIDTFTNPTQNSNLLNRIGSQLRNVGTSILTARKASPQLTQYFQDSNKEFYVRPEDVVFAYRITAPGRTTPDITQTLKGLSSKLFSNQLVTNRGNKKQPAEADSVLNLNTQFETYKTTKSTSGSATFKDLESRLDSNGYLQGNFINLQGPFTENPNDANRFTKTLKDPLNLPKQSLSDTSLYKNILGSPETSIPLYQTEENKSDIIKFIFQVQDSDPVHFRAFLSSLKETVRPDFNEQRYVGRTERFVTYGGVKRNATLQFNIVAFSKDEIDQAWTRVNYLTGLAFPLKASTSGFMTPPLFRLTIGGIYEYQPCYIENLDFDFLDETITFDIDKEVSQTINVNMSIVLLEKRSKFYDSPFYKITEDLEQTV